MTKYFVIAIAILGLMLTGSTAQAETCNFDVSSGNWADSGSWSCDHVPTADDLAVIQSGNTCTMNVAAAVADRLTVESTATLNIQASKTLTLDDDGANGSTINGTVNLQGSGSVLAFIDNDQTIDGTGKIVGQHNSAQITITAGETLTNRGTIEGRLEITNDSVSATFKNLGTVHANAAGTLEISTNAFADGTSAALWKVSTSSNAVLHINVVSGTYVTLEGSFVLEDVGTLKVDSIGFKTTGELTWTGGTIEVAEDSLIDFSPAET